MRLHRSVRDRLRGSEPCSRPSITAVRRLPTAFLSLCPLPLRPELSVFFFQPKFKQPAPNSPGLTRLGERGFQIPSTILEFPELGKNRRIVQESEARPIFYTGPGAGCLGEEPPRDWGPARSGAATTPAKSRKKKNAWASRILFYLEDQHNVRSQLALPAQVPVQVRG